MAGLFGSITIKGNRLTEFASQTATVGVPIPYGYGRFPCEGNVIFAPMPPKEHVKKKKQGKGGVKTEEYSYTLSYAVAFCEGPIFGFLTIKRNGKVVWTQDPNASVDDRAYAAKWKQKATFYFGTEEQLPDSTIESYRGVGQVSAFRGIAYIVVEDDDVTDGGGAVPTYEAVIIASPPDIYVTSHPFPIIHDDGISTQVAPVDGLLRTILHVETIVDGLGVEVGPQRGYLRTLQVPVNGKNALSAEVVPTGGSLKQVQKLANQTPSAVTVAVSPLSGNLKRVLITANQPAAGITTTVTPIGGSLA